MVVFQLSFQGRLQFVNLLAQLRIPGEGDQRSGVIPITIPG
jgi:hypothetical protein